MNYKKPTSNVIILGLSSLALLGASSAFAQNLGYFSSAPIDQHPNHIVANKTIEAPVNVVASEPVQTASVAPVTEPNPQIIISSPEQEQEIIIQDTPKRRHFWSWPWWRKNEENQAHAPRGPIRAIYEDSKTAIVQDIPQSLADHLPWVDSERKNQEFNQVLARVSNDLARANAADPEWALPAQTEIRALANRLERLSAPPMVDMQNNAQQYAEANQISSRPFRPRPIWPGAVQTIEPQNRPVSLTTKGVEEAGAPTSGEVILWQSPPENDEAGPNPPPARSSRRNRTRH